MEMTTNDMKIHYKSFPNTRQQFVYTSHVKCQIDSAVPYDEIVKLQLTWLKPLPNGLLSCTTK